MNGPAVSDQQESFARALVADGFDEFADPLVKITQRLSPRWVYFIINHHVVCYPGKRRGKFAERATLQIAKGAFSKRRGGDDLQVQCVREDLRRLQRPGEVARKNNVKVVCAQRSDGGVRLLSAAAIELRLVILALHQFQFVPGAFPVTHEHEWLVSRMNG